MSFFQLTDDEEEEEERELDVMDIDDDDDDEAALSSGEDAYIGCAVPGHHHREEQDADEMRVREIDSSEAEQIFQEQEEEELERLFDDDELGPPAEFTYREYQRTYADLTGRMKAFSDWIERMLKELPQDPEGRGLPYRRMETLWDKWFEFLMAYEATMNDTLSLVTHTDRSVKVCHGAYAFANMLQMYFLQTFPSMYKARQEIEERFDRFQDDALLDDIEGVAEDHLPGGWGDGRNKERKWARSDELRGESRRIRLFRFKVYHLGPQFDGWITRLSKKEYDQEQRLRRMTHEQYCQFLKTKEEPEKVDPYVPTERVCLPHWKRVVDYSQWEVMRAIKLLTRDMDHIDPTPALRDFFDALLYRTAIFFTETAPGSVLDEPEYRQETQVTEQRRAYIFNRRFLMFTYFYFYPVLRQFFFWEMYADPGNQFEPMFRADPKNDAIDIRWLLKKGESRFGDRFVDNRGRWDDVPGCTDEEVAAVRKWVVETVLPGLGEEGFNALYEECVEEAYRIESDVRLYKFLKPENPDNTAAVLRDMRPEDPDLSSELFQEYEVSLHNITTGVGNNLMSDIFMMWAIGRYWESLVRREMDWKETFTIDSKTLCRSTLTIQESSRPLLVQIFGSFYVICEGRAHKPRTLMEAVALWFKCIDRWFDGVLDWEVKSGGRYVARIEIKDLLQEIFHPKKRYADRGRLLHQRPLE